MPRLLGDFLSDLRVAVRTLGRAPAVTIVTLASLAIGTGAVAAVYALADTVLLRPLPFASPGRLVALHGAYDPLPPHNAKRWLDLTDWQAMRGTFSGVAATERGALNLTLASASYRVTASLATPNLFALLGVQPTLGRTFLESEAAAGHDQVALLSASLWRRWLGASPDILGRSIMLNGQPFTVVGILPDSFRFPRQTDVWLPYALPQDPARFEMFRTMPDRAVLARLQRGVSLHEARVAVAVVERAYRRAHPTPFTVDDVTITPLQADLVGDVGRKIAILIGAAILTLLLACANVAGLLLARADARRHEIAVRAALGATSGRLVRGLVAEGVLLAAAGVALGALLAFLLDPVLAALVPGDLTGVVSVHPGPRTFAYAAVAGATSVVLFCIAPAFVLARAEVHGTLTAAGPRTAVGTRRTWRGMLVGQVALTTVILVGAGLLLKSLWLLEHVDLGFRPAGVLTASVALPMVRYHSPGVRRTYFRNALAAVQEVRGASDEGIVNILPFSGGSAALSYTVVEHPYTGSAEKRPFAEYLVASPGYFRVLHIPVLAGRAFTRADEADAAHVVVVDERFARQIGPPGAAIGEHVRLSWDTASYRIVGVVRSVRDITLTGRDQWSGQFYFPASALPSPFMTFVVRGPVEDAGFVRAVRGAILRVDPTVPPFAVRTMSGVVAGSTLPERTVTRLITIGAGLALLLAVAGLFGITAAYVARRTREIGIRVALGSSPVRTRGLILRQAASLAAWGAGLGVVGAFAVTRTLRHLLYATGTIDPEVVIATAICILLATLAGSLVPMERAARIDPARSLRSD